MDNCVFCKIRDKQIPAKLLYDDEEVMAFADINPVKPVHILIVPKEHIADLLQMKNPAFFVKLFDVIQKMVAREGLKDKGFRVVVNGGGAQAVQHLHFHLMGPIGKTAAL